MLEDGAGGTIFEVLGQQRGLFEGGHREDLARLDIWGESWTVEVQGK